MVSAFLIVLPIFALIGAGYLAGRIRALGATAVTELNRFVVTLAVPALLFDAVASAEAADLWQPGFAAAFVLSGLIVMGFVIAVGRLRRRPLADAALDGLGAGYPNVGFVGFPIAITALGPEALVPTTIAAITTMCVIFALTIVLVEIDLQTERRIGRLIAKVGGSLLRNPMMVAPVLGSIFPLTGWSVPEPGAVFLELLAGAAAPTALVTLGLFLAHGHPGGEARPGAAALTIAAKLLLQPAVALALALAFGLSPALTGIAVVMASLPTGTGAFMLAEYYGRDPTPTSHAILGSTLLSIVTVAVCLALAV